MPPKRSAKKPQPKGDDASSEAQADGASSQLSFKNAAHSSIGKSVRWRTLKQITTALRATPFPPDTVTYTSIDAPPSLKPQRKYCDISGLPAPYTDPHTKLRFHCTKEYRRIKTLPPDVVAEYLAARSAEGHGQR